jgi:hypothetical protein
MARSTRVTTTKLYKQKGRLRVPEAAFARSRVGYEASTAPTIPCAL